jgi:peptide/nickel transport system substrate-binding protein
MTKLYTILILMGLFVVTACSSAPTSVSQEDTVLRVAVPDFGAAVMDPSLEGKLGLLYHGPLYDFLIGAGPSGRPDLALGLVERWETNEDATRYTLILRQGMHWHDGVEITTEDIAFNLEHYPRAIAVCAVCSDVEEALDRVEIVDRYTARLHLKRPDPEFLSNLGSVRGDMPLLPKHYYETVGAPGFEDVPLGSGPWRFVDQVRGEYVEFEANRDYWNAERVPGFDRLRLIHVPAPEDRLSKLRAGELDLTIVLHEDVEQLKAEGFQVQGPRYVLGTLLRFFMSYDPAYLTSSLPFRKALALGVDVEAAIQGIFPEEVAVAAPSVPFASPVNVGWDPSFAPYPYDPQTARTLLEESGYAGEPVYVLSILAYGMRDMPRTLERLAKDWRAIGLNVQIVSTDYPDVMSRFVPRPQNFVDIAPAPIFHGAYENWHGTGESIYQYMTSATGTMMSYYDLESGDRLYQEIFSIADPQERDQRIREALHDMAEEYWVIPLAWRHDTYAVSSNVTGWQPTDGTSYDLRLETLRPARLGED